MKDFILKHRGAALGGLLGMVIALLFLLIGFWKTVLVILLIGVGIIIGMTIDGNQMIKNSVDKFKSK